MPVDATEATLNGMIANASVPAMAKELLLGYQSLKRYYEKKLKETDDPPAAILTGYTRTLDSMLKLMQTVAQVAQTKLNADRLHIIRNMQIENDRKWKQEQLKLTALRAQAAPALVAMPTETKTIMFDPLTAECMDDELCQS